MASSEERFLEQADEFVELALKAWAWTSVGETVRLLDEPPVPLTPVVIADFRRLSDAEKDAIADAFYGPTGTAYYIVENADEAPSLGHLLLDMSEQLVGRVPVAFPLDHEKDVRKVLIERIGEEHGIVEVFDQGGSGVTGSDDLYAHQAGMGSCGAVATTVIHTDVAPDFGGFTYFQNVAVMMLALAATDPAAFRAMFLPDVLTVQRRAGAPGIRIQAPVLFVNEDDCPQSFIQTGNRGYEVIWREGDDVDRGRAHLKRILRPLAGGSGFVHFTRPGHGIFTRNAPIAHGRTAFGDAGRIRPARRLARKWYVTSPQFASPRQAPGLIVKRKYAELFPRFLQRDGFWQCERGMTENVRVA
jgi:hypothetical protein